jgi:hypothetical protein
MATGSLQAARMTGTTVAATADITTSQHADRVKAVAGGLLPMRDRVPSPTAAPSPVPLTVGSPTASRRSTVNAERVDPSARRRPMSARRDERARLTGEQHEHQP